MAITEQEHNRRVRERVERDNQSAGSLVRDVIYDAIYNALPPDEVIRDIIGHGIRQAVTDAFPTENEVKELIYIAIKEGVREAFSEYLDKHGLPKSR